MTNEEAINATRTSLLATAKLARAATVDGWWSETIYDTTDGVVALVARVAPQDVERFKAALQAIIHRPGDAND